MYIGAVHNRRGAKARKLSKHSHGTSPSHDIRQDHSSTQQQTRARHDLSNPNHVTQPARPNLTWTEAIGHPPSQQVVQFKNPTYHIVAHDAGHPFPFEHIPHLILTRRCSGSTLIQNEIVFRHIYPIGHAATKEMLQSCLTEAHVAIKKRLGLNLLHTDVHGDIITIVTKK